MKKLLISVIIILLLILTYFALAKGIGFLNIKSINDIKVASSNLDDDYSKASEISNKTYPEEVDGLEEAIRKLKTSKQEYENKNLYSSEETSLGTVEIKTYKIHYLWTILGNYRKDRGVQSLNLDLRSTQNADVYDLQFTLMGSYTSITDFLYDIENDEELNFEIKDFVISSEIDDNTEEKTSSSNNSVLNNNSNSDNTTSESTESNNNNENTESNNNDKNTGSNKTTKKSDGIILQAKFTVESVGITLD